MEFMGTGSNCPWGECQEITKRPVSSWQKIKKNFWEVSRLETFDEQHSVFRIDAAEVQLREEDVPKLVSQKVCGSVGWTRQASFDDIRNELIRTGCWDVDKYPLVN